jgi:Inner membrane component of T3SS, cytoplasmic domain
MDRPVLRIDPHSLRQPHSLPALAEQPSGARVSLEITRGRVQQRIRPVSGKVFLIGAASDCDLVLGDLQFPEAYAYVFVTGNRVSIRRLGAGPVLLVCGEPVESGELFHGDLVELGPFELRVLIEDAPRGGRGSDDEMDSPPGAMGMDAEQAGAVHEVRLLLMEIRRQMAGETPVLRMYDELPEEHEAEAPRRISA